MTQNPLFEIRGLLGGYNEKPVVKDISLAVNEGEFLGVIGPNGSGKSTLLKLATRVIAPEKGEVLLEGCDIRSLDLKKIFQKVAFVPQETFVPFSFTVEEMVLLGRIPHLGRFQLEGRRDASIAENAMRLTETLALKDKKIDELSSGERQRVFFARALAQEPVLLFLDEPTSHLDIGHQIQLLDFLKKLNRENNLTVLIVLHDLNLASEYCHRIILMEDGKIFKEGTPEEVLTYQNIEAVYKTVVVVKRNPISQKPYLILVPQSKTS